LLDELLRRNLGVSDPRDAEQLAQALARKYPDKAARVLEEAQGLPVAFGRTTSAALVAPRAESVTLATTALDAARRAAQADLDYLLQHNALRYRRPELRGWGAAVEREFVEGAAAALRAQDTTQRSRVVLAMRKLNDMALAARYAGALRAEVRPALRRLAGSLDRGASALLVSMGEALYNSGLVGTPNALSISVEDLRERRDAVLMSLRRLLGVTETRDPLDTSAPGYLALSALLKTVQQRGGEQELLIYLHESTLRATIEKVVNLASGATGESLRTAQTMLSAELERLHRLSLLVADVKAEIGSSASVSLDEFAAALGLFVESFQNGAAVARLVELAVPVGLDSIDGELTEHGPDLRAIFMDMHRHARTVDDAWESEVPPQLVDPEWMWLLDVSHTLMRRAAEFVALGAGKLPGWTAAPLDSPKVSPAEASAQVMFLFALSTGALPYVLGGGTLQGGELPAPATTFRYMTEPTRVLLEARRNFLLASWNFSKNMSATSRNVRIEANDIWFVETSESGSDSIWSVGKGSSTPPKSEQWGREFARQQVSAQDFARAAKELGDSITS
jgi:hypothetical protein